MRIVEMVGLWCMGLAVICFGGRLWMTKNYEEPIVQVEKYTPNQAVSACGTSVKVTCLIGGQELVFYSSCSGGTISEFYEYEYTDSDGNTTAYIIWYYDYGTGPNNTSGTWWDALKAYLNGSDSEGWHIATKEEFGNNLYANS